MPTNTPRLALPKGNGGDNARDYLKGAISGGGLWRALEILDDAVLQSSVNVLDNVTLNNPTINGWTNAQHTHASAATAGSTLGPGTTLSTPTLQTPGVSGVMTFGGDATLQRTAAGALRVNSHLGVQADPDTASVRASVRLGNASGVYGDVSGTTATAVLASNTYYDGGNNKAIIAAPAAFAAASSGQFQVWTAPSVAAGATQTHTQRLSLDNAGNLGLGNTPVAWRSDMRALHLAGGGAVYGQTGNGNVYLGNNTYITAGSVYTSQYNAPGAELSMTGGVLSFKNAPAVAPGATQTHTARFSVDTNGTVALTPVAGQPHLTGSGVWNVNVWQGTDVNSMRLTAVTHVAVDPQSNYFLPARAGINCGSSANYWGTVYAQTGTIQPSSQEVKADIAPLDPAVAMAAVRATEAVTFTYTAPPAPEGRYELPDDPEEAEQALLFRFRNEPLAAAARHQAGFVAEQADPLFLTGEGQSNPSNSVGVLLAALHDLDTRLTALEEGVPA